MRLLFLHIVKMHRQFSLPAQRLFPILMPKFILLYIFPWKCKIRTHMHRIYIFIKCQQGHNIIRYCFHLRTGTEEMSMRLELSSY